MRGPDRKPRRKRAVPPPTPRPGPGRPKGSLNMPSVKGLLHRIPPGTDPALAAVADEALDKMVDLMRRGMKAGGYLELHTAKEVRAEICGPIVQKHEVEAGRSLLEILKAMNKRAGR